MNNTSNIQTWFLHIDLDAFFASVEQLDNPQYRGLPVIVGGRKDDKRGVVSTASYEARKFGVHSAMPIFKALQLCPNGIYLRARMKRYAELSYEIMNIFKDFSPDVDQMSIDEAFVDLTGTEKLFGPPEKTALKIKSIVKEKTGLTVSVGLATTKYLAKIASGYSKPDGFYFIKPGDEQKFMLSLPLKKVWGIGPKALERLKRAGIYTTVDLFEKPYNLLEFLFGTTMASFLYDVVRGEEKEVFSRKAKSHSISAETTFLEDITDIYTAETELLELAHGVMFRLLKEEKFSRTITVKIKYDDFTSVSIQRTFENNIITLDTFYENIKSLFEEKYQKNRSIRLLGVGFDKVENNDKPVQQSLFSNKEDKKQAVEKAILNLSKKHPEIKIKKARLLKIIAIVFILTYDFVPSGAKLWAEDFSTNVTTESKSKEYETEKNTNTGAIFNWDINDKNKVDFNISGHWQGDIKGSLISTFNKNSPAFLDAPIPVFKQDIELSSIFTLNNKWYFEADFADNFSNNTLALGYNGMGYFKSGKLSNRNITMPNDYSAELLGFGLSGGNNQAPGFSANWQSPSKKWSSNLLIRYDMTIPKSLTFYGKNKVNDVIINPENFSYGYSYTFPEESKNDLKEIKNIYIESENGTYKDKNGRIFKKLSLSDYFYSETNNILYLSSSAEGKQKNNKIPVILITFLSPITTEKIILETGNYKDTNSFAGKIQLLFNKNNKQYNLENFSYPLATTIENEQALVIQNSEGFSPYLIANNYDCGSNKDIEVSVISKNSKNINHNYIGEIENNSFTSPYEDFFNSNSILAKIINKNIPDSRYPFADTNPEIYLNLDSESDTVLQLRTYTPVSKINIGQKASAGTINVLKNGRYISDFIYNVNTGDITFSEQIKNSDQIKITWEEEASDFGKGTISLGLGFQLNILSNLKWDIALTAQKPIFFDDSFSTPDNTKSSFIALSTGIDFNKSNFSLFEKAAFSIKKQNDSDKLLISTQKNSSPETYQQKSNSGYETKSDVFLNGKILHKKDNHTIKNHNGEKDSNLKGYKIPLQWDFSKSENNNSWAAVDLKLEGGKNLKNSSTVKIAICLHEPNPEYKNDYNFYIQFGINAGSEVNSQNKNIPTFNITDKIDFNNNNWQNITLRLSDKDRAYLVSNTDCRIIVEQKNKEIKNNNLIGKFYIGPYSSIINSIFTEADENIIITTTSTPSSKNSFSSEIKWTFLDTNQAENTIKAQSYFTPADFSPYKKINFKFAYEVKNSVPVSNESKTPDLSFILDTDNQYSSDIRNTAIQLDLFNISPYIDNIKKYHTVSIIQNKDSSYSIYVDNTKLENNNDNTLYKLQIDKNIVPSKVTYKINTIIGDQIIKEGSFYVDNITYEDSDYTYSFDNYVNTNYQKEKILTINNFPILSNGFIKATSTQKFSNENINVLSSLNTGINICGISLQTDLLLNKVNFENIGHNITTINPLLKSISFTESYRWNKSDMTQEKINDFALSLIPVYIPISVESTLSAKENNIEKEQNHNTYINSNFNIKNVDFSISSLLGTSQKINILKNNSISSFNDNYFKSWFDITKFQFSTGSNTATTRNTIFSNSIFANINNNFIKPEISYTLSSLYENINSPLFTDKAAFNTSVPININDHFIRINLSKTGGDTSDFSIKSSNNTYFSDLQYLFELQHKRNWFYETIPFYELFDQNMSSKINGNYSAKYELIYSKRLFNSFKDLYIPSSASFAIIRDIKTKDKFSDSYQLKITIANNSINNFGKNSEKQIFKWFNQEEISSGITAIVKIPVDKPENTTFNLSSYMQLLIMIKENSIINSFFDLSIETNLNWHTKGTIFYSRPGKNCLMSAIASFFSEKVNEIDFDILRKDSFTYSIGTNNKINRQQYDYNHSVEMSFLNYFTITNGIGLTVTYVENSSSQLAINYSLGGKISF